MAGARVDEEDEATVMCHPCQHVALRFQECLVVWQQMTHGRIMKDHRPCALEDMRLAMRLHASKRGS
eukprot:9078327-Pyramimonas_sp.AAC.1